MRIVGTRKQYHVSHQPSGAALKAGAAIQDTALALAIAENLIARKLVP